MLNYTDKLNAVEYSFDEAYENSGFIPHDVALKRAISRLGSPLALSMTDAELLNFVEGN